ncbi:hypothetical protein NOJ05_04725 [Neorhizobium galegae]|uniref:hypothetical protein n=1 Tax=Neorhizobium galegae TaxID=399 RepID=UPI00210289C6|nr:hypothetical protein [Neorhizobium galegae]MCQ1776491.1 hypothetical protein [Neorhizobium galegae]MCQ1799582.1 hypothetical protein [Neorhizobium galegae]
MTFDPNDRKFEPRDPDIRTTEIRTGSSSSWVPWVAVIAVILVGAFVWSQLGGSSTDPQTTSSTNPPVTDNSTSSPAPAPITPAAPPAASPAPATPPAGGATGGTGTQP